MNQKFIPLSVPNLKGNELEYVTNAIKTEWVSTGGSYINEFEEKIKNYVNSAGSVSCQNGTSGIHISLIECGVEREDEVIVPTLTFIAAVNPVRYIGAEPIFMDCDDSLCLDPIKLEKFCEEECNLIDGKLINKLTKKHIKAVIVVHVFGNIADMKKLVSVCKKYNLKLIEDSTEALGTYYTSGEYKGKYAGTIGDIGIYSFNGNKIITTGGGGMIVSNNDYYLKHSKYLTTQAKDDELFYIHDEIGYNYRMTNVQAAIGIAQLEQLETFIQTKKENYEYYKEEISKIKGLKILEFRENIRPNYWFYSLYLEDDFPIKRDELIDYLSKNKIQTRAIWGLIHEQKPYINNQTFEIEKAKIYIEKIVNIPCSSNLLKEDVKYVVDCLKNI